MKTIRRWLSLLMTLSLCLGLLMPVAYADNMPEETVVGEATAEVHAGLATVSPPDSAEAVVYGTSGEGRDLMAYRFGSGKNVMVLSFTIHGYEDNWDRDGAALVYTADELMDAIDENMELVRDYGWTIYVLPCCNPDGLEAGYTKNGPGRCTTTYLNSKGKLVTGKGIDMNRSFPTNWTSYSSNRNFNGSAPLASMESKALAEFIKEVRGSGNNLCIDAHGWLSQIITSNGSSSKLYKIFKEEFPENYWANVNNGRGYFASYAASLGYASCLFEFPDGLYRLSSYKNSGYCEKYADCILELLKAYGTYTPHSEICPTRDFTDVDQEQWYHEALDYVVEKGIFNGMSETSFQPDLELSRAMLVTVLWRMSGSPAAKGSGTEFSDVPSDQWYSDAVAWAQENGIVKGYPDGTFLPEDDIKRQDLALIFQRYAHWQGKDVSASASLKSFTDREKVDSYADGAVKWAVAEGIIQGMGDGTLAPLGSATRAQTATIIMRYQQDGSVSSNVKESYGPGQMEPIYYDGGEDLGGN